jgi:hypothetical protein
MNTKESKQLVWEDPKLVLLKKGDDRKGEKVEGVSCGNGSGDFNCMSGFSAHEDCGSGVSFH